MERPKLAKLFRNGRSQAVRLPKEFRFPGKEVRVRRIGNGVLLEPANTDVKEWFAAMDRLSNEPFPPTGRKQAKPQKRKLFQ
jgi:antitoxin VapB